MKLLILTQKVDINDDILGFFHSWVKVFAENCEQLTVICLEKGGYELPERVKVLSLGKEENRRLGSRYYYLFNFFRYLWRERGNYDAVFIHMNPEYVILGGIVWKLMKKKIALWYVHKCVDLKLRVAAWAADIVFTASKDGFRLGGSKVKVVGHGIDVAKFDKILEEKTAASFDRTSAEFNLVYIGRISRIKNQLVLIQALDVLVNKIGKTAVKLNIIGRTIYPDDEAYYQEIISYINKASLGTHIRMSGAVPNRIIGEYLEKADLSINLCPDGGMDKAVLESIAAYVPVIVFNKTFSDVLNNQPEFILRNLNAEELAGKINFWREMPANERKGRIAPICAAVRKNFGLDILIKKIISFIG